MNNRKNKLIPVTLNGQPFAVIIENPTIAQRVYVFLARMF